MIKPALNHAVLQTEQRHHAAIMKMFSSLFTRHRGNFEALLCLAYR
jgi:hypothetical protein